MSISGRVQGVFFRASCAREARRLHVSGWIRNTPGGGVEAVFEGPDGDVDALIGWCRSGPDLARVEAVQIAEEALTGEDGFHVLH